MSDQQKYDQLKSSCDRYNNDLALLSDILDICRTKISNSFILDSERGVKCDGTWIDKDPQEPRDSTDKIVSEGEVKSLAKWLNSEFLIIPSTAEDNSVFWTTRNKKNAQLAAISAFILGAYIQSNARSSEAAAVAHEPFVAALTRADSSINRKQAKARANGIIRFFGIALYGGANYMFEYKFSVRACQSLKDGQYQVYLNSIRFKRDQFFISFINSLHSDLPFRKMCEKASIEVDQVRHLRGSLQGQRRTIRAYLPIAPRIERVEILDALTRSINPRFEDSVNGATQGATTQQNTNSISELDENGDPWFGNSNEPRESAILLQGGGCESEDRTTKKSSFNV